MNYDGRPERRLLLLSVGALGVSCVTTQLVLMRELLCALTGNELVLGVVLANWLLLMGAGAWLGRNLKADAASSRHDAGKFLWLQIFIAILPILQVLAIRVMRNDVLGRGAAVGIGVAFAVSLVVLLPYCVVMGYLLALACALDQQAGGGEKSAGHVYTADSVGSILGGALFSLVLAWVFNSFVVLASVGLLCLALSAWVSWRWKRKGIAVAALAGGVYLVLAAFVFKSDAATSPLEHRGEDVLFRGNSPYGQIVVTRAGEQINFYQNGTPVVCTHNTAQVEEAAHYAMAQRPDARRVLLIGGGVAGTAKELLKYPAGVTCVELDPLFVELGRRFLPENLADPRIRVVNTDGRRFVQTSGESFDVIIMDLADPTTAQLNRFHTAEFLAEAKHALTSNGVLELAVGRYENFVSPELGRILATANKTLRGTFSNVVLLPGGRVFFLASDGALGTDIAGRLERVRVATSYVNRHYLDAMLTPDRMADLQRAVAGGGAMNRDFSPVLYFQCLRLWASQFNTQFGVAEAALAMALLIYLARLRGVAATVFASGFAASSLEVVLLLGFQALCGSLYYQLGIIVTVFMAGLAAGAAFGGRVNGNMRLWLAGAALCVAALAFLAPLLLTMMRSAALETQVGIVALTFAIAVPVGAQFPLANRVEFNGTNVVACRLFTADFTGAFIGALLASTLLIPLIGIKGVCLLAGSLNALAAAALFWKESVT